MSGDVETTIATMRDAAQAMRSVSTSVADEVRAIDAAIRVLELAKCDRLAEMDQTKSHESEGASSIATWGRRELGQDAGLTRQMVRAVVTCRDLPAVAEAAQDGLIGFDHVNSFTYAIKHLGVDETRQLQGPLLEFAKTLTASEFHAKVREVRDVLHPEQLDQAWRKGMEKRDLRVVRTIGGYHVTGFLDIETGAKLTAVLSNLSVPRDAQDDRTAAHRRMDALDDLCTSVLEHGLPADNGVRPHVTVTVEADTLKAMAEHAATETLNLDLKPATVHGFGPIGPQLLAHLICGSEITPILIKTINKNIDVLDVGRTERLATPRQAKAISLRQAGTCANRGCRHPIGNNHHVIWWTHGGDTDLDVLIGLCRKCHSLVHSGRLRIIGTYRTGFVFTTARGSPLSRAA